jgi:hypothetical protein
MLMGLLIGYKWDNEYTMGIITMMGYEWAIHGDFR